MGLMEKLAKERNRDGDYPREKGPKMEMTHMVTGKVSISLGSLFLFPGVGSGQTGDPRMCTRNRNLAVHDKKGGP